MNRNDLIKWMNDNLMLGVGLSVLHAYLIIFLIIIQVL